MSLAPSFIFLFALPLLAAPGSRVLAADRRLLSGQTTEAVTEFRAALAGTAGAERAVILDGLGREAQKHFAASIELTEAGGRPWAIAISGAGQGRARTRTNLAILLMKINGKAEAVAEREAAVGQQQPDVAVIPGHYREVLREAGLTGRCRIRDQRSRIFHKSAASAV